jgi:cephalosporin-C deacetylase-like acetyl esterase
MGSMSRSLGIFLALVLAVAYAGAQSDAHQMSEILKEVVQSPAVADFQVRQYIVSHTAPPPVPPPTAGAWTAEASRLRQHILNDVVFHGWPKAWVDAPPKFEEVGILQGTGYRIHKLRYEVVPGLQSAALLYEPQPLGGKVAAVLNVYGHVGPAGKAVEFEQKRNITLARHGVLSLQLDWLGFGELSGNEADHFLAAHLDLVGVNEVGLFYLEMRRGLDYLYNLPNVDRNRLGMTGLSGGGWQTILLSSLDERVTVSVPVAGFSSLRSRVEVKDYGDMGDPEQSATDLLKEIDFTHLIAMRAPRPTLLSYNAEDDCCFRADVVKPLIFEGTRPFFKLYGKEDGLRWHENRDPGTHNYQLDNRLATYRFFSQQFGLPLIANEDGVASELKSYDDLTVGLPKDNLTLLSLAQKLGGEIQRRPALATVAERTRLKEIVRYGVADIRQVWHVGITKNNGVQTESLLFEMNNGLTANGIWLQAIDGSAAAPVTIVLNDEGKENSATVISDKVNRGEQVLAFDPTFIGSTWKDGNPYLFAQMVDGVGYRPIGLQAAQLIQVARWAAQRALVSKVRVEADGIRSQLDALISAAIEPDLFSEVSIHNGMRSLRYALDLPLTFYQAPELFCLDLYKEFDLDRIAALAGPAKIVQSDYLEIPAN